MISTDSNARYLKDIRDELAKMNRMFAKTNASFMQLGPIAEEAGKTHRDMLADSSSFDVTPIPVLFDLANPGVVGQAYISDDHNTIEMLVTFTRHQSKRLRELLAVSPIEELTLSSVKPS